MDLLKNVALAEHSTMHLGGRATYAVEIYNRNDLLEAVTWAAKNKQAVLIIGDGSNIVWRDEGFNGLLLINKVLGYDGFAEDEENYYLTLGAGENWDSAVERVCQDGLSGMECLSLIPGTVGATPVQNVGAYGQEISQTLVSLEAYDNNSGELITIAASDCGFGYRTSRFKTIDRGRFLIMAVTLHLLRLPMQPPFYGALEQYLQDKNISDFSPINIRKAVCAIRRAKLPDPAVVANNGSFFANPIIDNDKLQELQVYYPEIPHWPTAENGQVKIPAAWLIEQTGFKDYHDEQTGMATWPSQPLVLINESARSTTDLLKFKQKIVTAIKQKFDIELVQEPEILP
ncbi:MAG: UDP-N-acetylmuramate dehydrogenase [Candidatus Saccharimonadales bacterium]